MPAFFMVRYGWRVGNKAGLWELFADDLKAFDRQQESPFAILPPAGPCVPVYFF